MLINKGYEMKKLFPALLIAVGLFAFNTQAQTVNNRTFIIDPPVAAASGVPTPTEWRLYCTTNPDTTTWNKPTALTKTVILPALTTGVLPLADTITHCAATFAGAGALESLYSNVVYAKLFNAPVIKITMDLNILFQNFAELVTPIIAVKVNGITLQ